VDRRRVAAEAFGTFWLVLGGCGSAVLAGPVIGPLGISLAFGLSVLTMAYAVGGISGGQTVLLAGPDETDLAEGVTPNN